MRLRHAAELRLPVAVEDHPVDLAGSWTRLPAVRLRGVEPDVFGGASRIVGIKKRLDRPLAEESSGDCCSDTVAGHVGQFLIHKQSGVGSTLAYEAGIQPLFGDALELTEEVKLRLLAGVAPFRIEKPMSDLEDERG